MKRVVGYEAKFNADEKWSRRLTELQRVKENVLEGSTQDAEKKVKAEDGELLNEEDYARKRWAEHFERLLNVKEVKGG